jgi:nucleoside 2-deoxyribosyltransferase
MSEANPIRLFVTHGWEESEDYLRVFEFLESARDFFYRNCSVLEPRPQGDKEKIREALRAQIRPAEIVIALGSMVYQDAEQLEFEMTFAQAVRKPVLLVPRFGKASVLPPKLTALATEIGEWDSRALVDAVRRLARGEATNRWDVVEFKIDD